MPREPRFETGSFAHEVERSGENEPQSLNDNVGCTDAAKD